MAIITTIVVIRCEVSAAVELAWVMDLLVQTARYAEPALDELDRSLLPGIASLRAPIKEHYAALWADRLAGCPELLLVAAAAHRLEDPDARRLLTSLTTLPKSRSRFRALAGEPAAARRSIRRREALLESNVRMRRAYRDVLAGAWDVIRPAWERRGRAIAARAVSEWKPRLAGLTGPAAFVAHMPPRHPLSRAEPAAAASLVRRRRSITLVPTYFCMSGGLVADLDDRLLVAVPASALEPIRRTRDAAFVADRTRVLSEATRVRILIHLMSAPSGVMQMTRALGMSQPTVSEHVRVLAAAGLVRAERRAGRTVYLAHVPSVQRLLTDVMGTLDRWG